MIPFSRNNAYFLVFDSLILSLQNHFKLVGRCKKKCLVVSGIFLNYLRTFLPSNLKKEKPFLLSGQEKQLLIVPKIISAPMSLEAASVPAVTPTTDQLILQFFGVTKNDEKVKGLNIKSFVAFNNLDSQQRRFVATNNET